MVAVVVAARVVFHQVINTKCLSGNIHVVCMVRMYARVELDPQEMASNEQWVITE